MTCLFNGSSLSQLNSVTCGFDGGVARISNSDIAHVRTNLIKYHSMYNIFISIYDQVHVPPFVTNMNHVLC